MQDSLAQLSCLKEACKRLALSYAEKDVNGNLIEIDTPKGKLLFANFSTPFNSGVVERICKDKGFTYELLRDVIPMPKTKSYVDPHYREGYERFKKYKSIGEIADDSEAQFRYPVVVKKNAGTRGINVFLCNTKDEAQKSLEAIFARTADYDYAALAQEYIPPQAEYRAIFFRGKALLCYTTQSLWSKGSTVAPEASVAELEAFFSPILKRFPVAFTGADIIRDKKGKLWLLELNSCPGFARFIKEHGTDRIVEMYERILQDID